MTDQLHDPEFAPLIDKTPTTEKVYVVRVWDPNNDEWENMCVCLTLGEAKVEQTELAKHNYTTNVIPLPVKRHIKL